MTGSPRPITRTQPAYQPSSDGVRRPWLALVAALFLAALVAVLARPSCRPDRAGADEAAFGVRHQKRGGAWYHCEPWITSVVRR